MKVTHNIYNPRNHEHIIECRIGNNILSSFINYWSKKTDLMSAHCLAYTQTMKLHFCQQLFYFFSFFFFCIGEGIQAFSQISFPLLVTHWCRYRKDGELWQASQRFWFLFLLEGLGKFAFGFVMISLAPPHISPLCQKRWLRSCRLCSEPLMYWER